MILAPVIRQRYLDANGLPLVGGKLYTYAAGTTTPQATYTDQGGLTPNTNPVILDSSGYADIWVDPSLAYKFVLKDSSDAQQWSRDNVSGAATTGIEGWNATSNYSDGAIVSDASGAGLLYVSLQDNNVGNALSNVTYWRMFGGGIRTVTTNTTLAVTDEIVRSNSTSGALTHTLPACSSTPIGKRITVKDIGSGGFTTSVRGSGTDQVDGAVTYATALSSKNSVTVINTGTSWDAQPQPLVDGAVSTSAKLASGVVTQDKLAARAAGTTVAAGGVAVSASSGAFTTASTSYVSITNLSVTITTTGRPVMLFIQSDGATSSGNMGFSGGGGSYVQLQLLRAGVGIAWSMAGINVSGGTQAPGGFPYVDAVAAGTYTYSIQIKSSVGGTVGIYNSSLVAYEI